MARTANIYTRIDPDVKEQAEQVLAQLGIPMSNAIGMFLRQVVLQNGIPFDMKLPVRRPPALYEMTEEQLDRELQKGYDDILAGRTHSFAEVAEEMRSRYGV